MKNIRYILLVLFCILLNSCKAKLIYWPYPDTPYTQFSDGSTSGVMVTETQQILIPAKYGWIDRYLTSDSYPPKSKDIFYFGSYRADTALIYVKSFLFNVNGKLLYTFDEGEDVKSLFYHNKQLYLITKKQLWGKEKMPGEINMINCDDKLFRLDANKNNAVELCTYSSITHLGKNMIYIKDNKQFGCFDLNSDTKILFKNHTRGFQKYLYVKDKNEIWTQIDKSETQKTNEYYDTVIDSTLNVKPNPAKNVISGDKKYYFSETEKGIQIIGFDGTASPFAYPFLEPVKNSVMYGANIYFGKEIILDKLFVFSPQKQGDIKGIIDLSGKIILPAEFSKISMKDLSPTTQPSPELINFFKNNNLLSFHYFTIKNEGNYNLYSIYNPDGKEIINFKDKGNNCSYQFDFMEKKRLQIKFYSSDATKIYDLNTKELISTELRRK